MKLVETKTAGILTTPELQHSIDMNQRGSGIYVWTHTKDGNVITQKQYKIGQYGTYGVPKLPEQTIGSYTGKTNISNTIFYARKLDQYLKQSDKFSSAYQIQHAIHSELLRTGSWKIREGRSTEFFGGKTLDQIKHVINNVLYGTSKLNDFKMRQSQVLAHDKIVEYFKSGGKQFLFAAKMRFGKNHTLLNICKTMGLKNVLIITYKPYVYDSLIQDIESHIDFSDFTVCDYKQQRKFNSEKNKSTNICLCSAQLALNKNANGQQINPNASMQEMSKTLSHLKTISWDLIAVDEYHYGGHTFNFNTILQQLQCNHILYMSGTPFKDLSLGVFSQDQIYTWTYIDQQRKKVAQLEIGYGSYIDMPSMKMYCIDISSDAKLSQAYYTQQQQFRFAKLLDNNNGVLKDPGSLRLLLKAIIGCHGHKRLSPYSTVSGLTHTFWVLPKNTKGIIAMAELMRSMPQYQGYDIIPATGNEVTDIKEVKQRIAAAEYQKKGTITLTCYRFKQGVTIPQWDGVLMLDDGSSPEQYIQAIFRAQSPNKLTEKKECYVFDFNPNRALNMTYQLCENMDNTYTTDVTQLIRQYLEYCPILSYADNGWKSIQPSAIIQQFRQNTSLRQKFQNIPLDVSKISQSTIEILSNLRAVSQRSVSIDVNENHGVLQGKTSITGHSTERQTKKRQDAQIKQYKEKIKTALSMIPVFMFVTTAKQRTWQDIKITPHQDLFRLYTGVSVDEVGYWLDTNIIVGGVGNFNRTLMYVDDEITALERNFTSQAYDDFVKKHFTGMTGANVKTPLVIIDRMIEMCNIDFSNPNQKILDPCMGTGSYLLRMKQRFMQGLKSIFPDERERETYILGNILYGLDIEEYKVFMAQKIINGYNYSCNLFTGNALNLKEVYGKDMKFDLIISNPPYNNGLDLKILKAIYPVGEKMCFIHPAGWLLSKNEKKTKTIGETVKGLIANDLCYYEPVNNANKLFNIAGTPNDIYINIFDKNCGNPIDISTIDQHGNTDIYKSILNKVLHYCTKSNLAMHADIKDDATYNVGFASIIGHTKERDFFTFIQLKNPSSHLTDRYKKNNNFLFKTQNEQLSFFKYLYLKLMRFSLSIYKVNKNVILSSVPYMPTYTHEWTDEMVAKEIGLTDQELRWAINWIPDYYPEDAERYAKYYDPEQTERQRLSKPGTFGGNTPNA